jgi:hypothetical protein
MLPFGRAMSPLQNHIIIWNYLDHLKEKRSAKKRWFFRKPIFQAKGRNLAPF